MTWLLAIPLVPLLIWWGRREWLLYRGFSNSSRAISEGTKKSPPQAEAGTGIEYGGTHLP